MYHVLNEATPLSFLCLAGVRDTRVISVFTSMLQDILMKLKRYMFPVPALPWHLLTG